MHTMQSWFDEAISYLRTMPRQALESKAYSETMVRTWCSYANKYDERCIVGHFIPVGHPAELFDSGVSELADHYPSLDGIAWPADSTSRLIEYHPGIALATHMQVIHDDGSNWDESGFIGWEAVAEVAENFGLNYIDMKDLALVSV